MIDLKTVPEKPGIYQYFDKHGKLLYIGKAKNLKKRVSSYFQSPSKLLPKTQQLVAQIDSIKTIVVESELEALLLEATLIKKHLPKYNSELKDDRSFLYIVFTKEDFPRIFAARKKEIEGLKFEKKLKIAFGPFPNSKIVRQTLRDIRSIFLYRSCTDRRFNIPKVCLYFDLNLCSGPCEAKISKIGYQKEIKKLIAFFQGKTDSLLSDLKREMNTAAKSENFEQAAILRDQIEKLNYLRTHFRTPEEYLEAPNLIEDLRQQTLVNLQQILNLPGLPQRIECYDISNFQGKQAVGSMVVFTDGEPDKKEYRRFRIKTKHTPDDFAMLQEVLSRRFKKQNGWTLPDLLIIDGGAGQLSSVMEILKEKDIHIPVVSLAKREEEIYVPQNNAISQALSQKPAMSKVILSRHSPELRLFQRIRDEAHRFAITYHRKLRTKEFTPSK